MGIYLNPNNENFARTLKRPIYVDKTMMISVINQFMETDNTYLIHCGTQDCDLPTRFERFFAEYHKAHVILAHSNPVKETAQMVNEYKNVFCDTSFWGKHFTERRVFKRLY